MSRVVVTGWGAWRPGQRGVGAEAVPVGDAPDDSLLPAAQRRRATLLARMGADVIAQALAGAAPVDLGLVLVSVGGELDNTFNNLDLLLGGPGQAPSSSPLRFGNSVHNAALGHLSIPFGNRAFGSALAVRGEDALATGLLETAAWVLAHRRPAVVVWAEEAWPTSPEGGAAPWRPLAAALALAPDGPGRGTLGLPRRDGGGRALVVPDDNPCGPAWALVDALAQGSGSLRVGAGRVVDWEAS